MFRRLRLKLALQFTALVFVLMLVLGGVFIAIEFTDVNRQLDARLEQQAALVRDRLRLPISFEQARWLHREAFNVRVTSGTGEVLYASDLFGRMDLGTDPARLVTVRADGSSYRVLTTSLPGAGGTVLQLAGQDRIGPAELPGEIAVFFIAAVLVTVLTAALGLWFARRSLAPAERMFERLTQFTHDASHELRTPLAVINSELDLALRTGDHVPHIAAAKEEVKAGAALIDDLLGLAALDAATLDGRPVDLSALVEREVERSASLARAEGVRLESRVESGVVARADEGLATQLVANLVGNALKFTPRDGVITVTLSRSELRIQDTGPGIAPEDLAHVFERFYQADSSRSQDGHGLGLAIARNIAEVHGWRIAVQSRPGKGATFIVTF
ncbi:MAG TPA: HAMP domain-containing sensor histidine kinase [Thermoleophilia bacterium]